MGFFDFLKPDPYQKFQKDNARFLLGVELEHIEKQMENLRAVGRTEDATKAQGDFYRKVFALVKENPYDPENVDFFTNISIRFAQIDFAKHFIEGTIKLNADTPMLDATVYHLALGRIYHKLNFGPEREYDCYEKAIAAKPYTEGKYSAIAKKHVASSKLKAKAHAFAWSAAGFYSPELAKHHKEQFKKLVPDLNPDDMAAVLAFIRETKR